MARKPPANKRPAPTTFAQDAAAEDVSVRQLCLKYKTSPPTLLRWASEAGIKIEPRLNRWRELPAGWMELAPTRTAKQLMEHYSLSQTSVRWLAKRTGVKILRATARRRTRFAPAAPQVEPTLCDQAAQFLRRKFCPVHRCDIRIRENSSVTWGDARGVPDHGRGRYYVDSMGVLANNEMVELARRLGWECKQWQSADTATTETSSRPRAIPSGRSCSAPRRDADTGVS